MNAGKVITAIIHAEQPLSDFKLPVNVGEVLEISCDGKQRWKDAFWKTSPKGFFNLLAFIAGLRVKGVKCFCLCGCYNDEISTAFPIGIFRRIDVQQNGFLSFFANDTEGYYDNNSGSVEITIKRLSKATI